MTTFSVTLRSVVLGVLTLAFVMTSGGWAQDHDHSGFLVGSSTDFTSIAKEIGGDRIQVYAPLPGYQEPELYIEEVFPSWIIQASRADGYVRIGLFADVWADSLMTDARNPRIDPGAPGHVDASQGIHVLEIPTGPVDRSRGEIHLQGNPHYLLDPLNGKIVADGILRALVAISPQDADFFTANAEDFKRRIDEAMVRWEAMAAPLRGKKLAAYHRTWSYLLKRFGLDIVGYVEPKPGISPSPLEIRNLVTAMVRQDVRLIIHAPVYHPRIPNAVARQVVDQIGEPVNVLLLPAHVEGVPEADNYFTLFDYILTTLNEALN
ncbi:MAG: metal ABC transporter substrate-binding protein [Candidatus Tectomicrobia bacterium]|nr:metal ABC transporter substrate-binding protein [Candidatus Tectomicrobia bacterium]